MEDQTVDYVYPAEPLSYKLMEELAQSQIATVHLALCRPFNQIVAIKVLNLDTVQPHVHSIVDEEAQLTRLISHPNILKIHCTFSVNEKVWIVMPFIDRGSCRDIMDVIYTRGFQEPVVATILQELLKGLKHLHDHGHAHKGVKAANIFLDNTGAVKLGDCGTSSQAFKICRWNDKSWECGWIPPPEAFDPDFQYSREADIWCFGVTALEVRHGTIPSLKDSFLSNFRFHHEDTSSVHLSDPFKDMLQICLLKEPSKRPTAETLLKHSFFECAHFCDSNVVLQILNHVPSDLPRLRGLRPEQQALSVTGGNDEDTDVPRQHEDFRPWSSGIKIKEEEDCRNADLNSSCKGKESLNKLEHGNAQGEVTPNTMESTNTESKKAREIEHHRHANWRENTQDDCWNATAYGFVQDEGSSSSPL